MSELRQQPLRWKPLTMVRKSVANVIHDAMAASSQGWIHFERSWPEHILQRIITLNEQHLAKRDLPQRNLQRGRKDGNKDSSERG